MNKRHIISFLLALAISFTIIVPQSSVGASLLVAAAEDEPQLAPEDEQAARELVARFKERLRTTNDIGPIIDELFVHDFSRRIQQAPLNQMPWCFIDERLLAVASNEDLRRYYAASINGYGLIFRLQEIAEYQKRLSGNDDEDYSEFEKVLTPEIINVLLSDPTIAQLVQETKEDEKDGQEKEDNRSQSAQSVDSTPPAIAAEETAASRTTKASEDGIIKNGAQLNGVSATFEKANELMRKHLASLPAIPLDWPNHTDAESRQSSTKFYPTTFDEGEYGYEKGTQVIQTDALPFLLYLIKINGQLKIQSVILYVD